MFSFSRFRRRGTNCLATSRLYDQDTFYNAFLADLKNCTTNLVIESPFITTRRMSRLLPTLRKLSKRGVRIVINTRSPNEHDGMYQLQAEQAIATLQTLNATVLYTAGHHRKLAIIDQTTLWEGSLNILSHNDSCEIMRKITSPDLARQMAHFLKLEKHLRQ